MKLFTKRVIEGDRAPYFYARSYYCLDSEAIIYHPWGINLLIRWGRRFYFQMFRMLSTSKFEHKMVQARSSLLRQYWTAGFDAGRKVRRDELIDDILKEFNRKGD
jgi:hypothetical protein